MKKIFTVVIAVVFVICLGISAFASNPEPEREAAERSKELTQKFEEMQARFKELSLEEKKEIYGIHDEITKLQVKLFDRYTKTGIMTAEEAAAAQKRIAESSRQNRENGLLPGTHHKKPR